MKITRQHLEGILIGLVAIFSIPLGVFAARTATPVLTGLFPSATVSINLPVPTSFSIGNATTTGSVYSNNGNALYFQVVALDQAGGTSFATTLLGSSTVNQAHGWQITWNNVPGAMNYRVYFSTSTPQAVTQYFNASSTAGLANNFYWFQSTSSPVFVSNNPTTNTGYVLNLNSYGPSWLNGGNIGIGTTSPYALLSVTGANGSTTPLFAVASTSIAYSTTTVFSVDSAGNTLMAVNGAMASIGSSTFLGTQGILGLGKNPTSSNGSSTIAAGKWQIDGYSNTGVRSCTFLVGTTVTASTGPCNQ